VCTWLNQRALTHTEAMEELGLKAGTFEHEAKAGLAVPFGEVLWNGVVGKDGHNGALVALRHCQQETARESSFMAGSEACRSDFSGRTVFENALGYIA